MNLTLVLDEVPMNDRSMELVNVTGDCENSDLNS